MKKILVALVVVGFVAKVNAQEELEQSALQLNTITTAVPFLLIAPDSRSGAMGDAGVASSPDANSMHWNVAKLAFVEKEMGVAVSYSPWLRRLVPDINMSYVSGYKKLGDDNAIGASLRYFSLGDIKFTDDNGNPIGDFNPAEFAVDLGYSQKFGDRFSGGIAARYIFSNLTGGIDVSGSNTQAGKSFAVDVGGKFVTLSNWDSQEALDASAESFQKIMADAQNYIKSPPTIVTGECNIWRNMSSFPAGKLSEWSK